MTRQSGSPRRCGNESIMSGIVYATDPCARFIRRGADCRALATDLPMDPGRRCWPAITTRCSPPWPRTRRPLNTNGPTACPNAPCAAKPRSPASAKRPTTNTGNRPTASSNSRSRRSSKPARMPASARMTSTGSPPTATTVPTGRGWPPRLASRNCGYSNMFWGGGGGGVCGAVGNASAAVATGMADCVVAFRSLAQGQYARYGRGSAAAARWAATMRSCSPTASCRRRNASP